MDSIPAEIAESGGENSQREIVEAPVCESVNQETSQSLPLSAEERGTDKRACTLHLFLWGINFFFYILHPVRIGLGGS